MAGGKLGSASWAQGMESYGYFAHMHLTAPHGHIFAAPHASSRHSASLRASAWRNIKRGWLARRAAAPLCTHLVARAARRSNLCAYHCAYAALGCSAAAHARTPHAHAPLQLTSVLTRKWYHCASLAHVHNRVAAREIA